MKLKRKAILVILFGLLLPFLVGCTERDERSINVPEGPAAITLKEFARQTNVEILFDLQIVQGVETHAVEGMHEPGSALRMMLEGTPLGMNLEKETGAFGVFRKKL